MADYQLWLGDCLEEMSRIEAGSVDAIIADPPYGISYNPSGGNGRCAKRGNLPPVNGDDKEFNPRPFISFAPIIALFGANHYAGYLPNTSGWLVWDKRDGINSNDMADCELIWTNQRLPARLFSHKWMGMIRDSERKIPRLHPTQKPVQVMIWVMDILKIPVGAIVLDPFMGSGTTGEACLRTARRFIGIEKDAHYYQVASQRLERVAAELRGEYVPKPAKRPIEDLPMFGELVR